MQPYDPVFAGKQKVGEGSRGAAPNVPRARSAGAAQPRQRSQSQQQQPQQQAQPRYYAEPQ